MLRPNVTSDSRETCTNKIQRKGLCEHPTSFLQLDVLNPSAPEQANLFQKFCPGLVIDTLHVDFRRRLPICTLLCVLASLGRAARHARRKMLLVRDWSAWAVAFVPKLEIALVPHQRNAVRRWCSTESSGSSTFENVAKHCSPLVATCFLASSFTTSTATSPLFSPRSAPMISSSPSSFGSSRRSLSLTPRCRLHCSCDSGRSSQL